MVSFLTVDSGEDFKDICYLCSKTTNSVFAGRTILLLPPLAAPLRLPAGRCRLKMCLRFAFDKLNRQVIFAARAIEQSQRSRERSTPTKAQLRHNMFFLDAHLAQIFTVYGLKKTFWTSTTRNTIGVAVFGSDNVQAVNRQKKFF